MFHIISSRAVSITLEGSVRVLVRAAQDKPVEVRTMIVVDPGKLPLCHQFPKPLFRTIHPLAYLAGEPCGYAGDGVVIIRIVSGFRRLGTWFRNWTRSVGVANQPPCESMRVTFIL